LRPACCGWGIFLSRATLGPVYSTVYTEAALCPDGFWAKATAPDPDIAHDQSAGEKHVAARELIYKFWETRNGCLSIQVLQEFHVAVTRKMARPLPIEEASEIIRDLSFWHIHTPTAEDVLGAIDIQRHYQISFWDAMMIQSAKCLGCTLIWSEDLTDGQMYSRLLDPLEPDRWRGTRLRHDQCLVYAVI
jgi:predicted nucleic acid-binding protein